jgi:hypothetical protein
MKDDACREKRHLQRVERKQSNRQTTQLRTEIG